MPDRNRATIAAPIAAATAIAAVTTFIRVRRRHGRLERLGGAALEALLNAVDANDPVTGSHVRRVARFSLALGEAADLSPHECHSIERVALFHDIGKIHEALFDVIHDDGSLTAEERRAVNTHPRRGADVLTPLTPFYPDLADGVLSHHERWDGKGYPRKLKGKQIPLGARIVAIADTFDAVAHSRRYRRGKGIEKGLQVISEGRGTQFDPTLADLFVSPPVVEAIKEAIRISNAVERTRKRRPEKGETVGVPDVSFRWRETGPRRKE